MVLFVSVVIEVPCGRSGSARVARRSGIRRSGRASPLTGSESGRAVRPGAIRAVYAHFERKAIRAFMRGRASRATSDPSPPRALRRRRRWSTSSRPRACRTRACRRPCRQRYYARKRLHGGTAVLPGSPILHDKDTDGNNLAASQACQAAKERLRLGEVGQFISITILSPSIMQDVSARCGAAGALSATHRAGAEAAAELIARSASAHPRRVYTEPAAAVRPLVGPLLARRPRSIKMTRNGRRAAIGQPDDAVPGLVRPLRFAACGPRAGRRRPQGRSIGVARPRRLASVGRRRDAGGGQVPRGSDEPRRLSRR